MTVELSTYGVAYPTYIASLNDAWSAYAESRTKILGYLPQAHMPRGQGFGAGFAAGYKAALLYRNTQVRVPALCRKSDPETSFQAAAVASRQAGKLRDLVIQHLQAADLTAGEIAARIGVPRDSISPRIAPLKRSGILHVVSGRGREAVYRLGNGVATE